MNDPMRSIVLVPTPLHGTPLPGLVAVGILPDFSRLTLGKLLVFLEHLFLYRAEYLSIPHLHPELEGCAPCGIVDS
jgi:hypothetical protein